MAFLFCKSWRNLINTGKFSKHCVKCRKLVAPEFNKLSVDTYIDARYYIQWFNIYRLFFFNSIRLMQGVNEIHSLDKDEYFVIYTVGHTCISRYILITIKISPRQVVIVYVSQNFLLHHKLYHSLRCVSSVPN